MNTGDLGALADCAVAASDPTARRRGTVQPSEPGFAAQMAAFYPYAQPPVDPQPRAGAGDEARQRAGVIANTNPSQRRRGGRES